MLCAVVKRVRCSSDLPTWCRYYHGGDEDAPATFEQIYLALKRVVVAHGGAVSHHHGVGKLRQPFNDPMYDSTTVAALRAVKEAVDPDNIFCVGNNVLKRE